MRRPTTLAIALVGMIAAVGLVLRTHDELRGEHPFPGAGVVVEPARIDVPPAEPPPGRALRFVAWGDARGGGSVFERVRAEIRARSPDFSVGLGDLVGMARPYQFEILRDQLAATGAPAFTIPGNHDVDPFGSLAPYESVMGPADWDFTVAGITFFGVDSAAGPVSAGGLRRFAERAPVATVAGRRVVVFTHHPPYAPAGRLDKAMPDADPDVVAFRAALQAAHATTFSGNFHAFDRREVGNVLQLVTGGAGSTLETEGLHHVLVVTATPTGFDVERVDLPPRHATPTFADRWTTLRDEASYVVRSRPVRASAILLSALAALAGLVLAVRRRPTTTEPTGTSPRT